LLFVRLKLGKMVAGVALSRSKLLRFIGLNRYEKVLASGRISRTYVNLVPFPKSRLRHHLFLSS